MQVNDTTRPRIKRLTLSSRRFRVGTKRTATSAAKRRRHGIPRGTTIRYALSEAATTTFRIDRAGRGRKVGKRCRKPTRANAGRRACVLCARGS